MRRKDLTYNEKSFLLWCWINRDSDKRCNLITSGCGHNLDRRSIQWYADYFGIPRQTLSAVFVSLRSKNIIKTNGVTFIDFSVFN
jgi:hypothetical protein